MDLSTVSNRVKINQGVNEIELDPFNFLPDEIVLNIFSYLPFRELSKICLMSRRWDRLANDLPLLKKAIYNDHQLAFGNKAWAKCSGLESIGESDTEEFESLAKDIGKILKSPCPAFPGKRVGETHMLVRIPKTFDGKPFSLKTLGEIAKKHFPKTENGYRYMWSEVMNKIGNQSVDESSWVLMTKKVLEGSRSKSYADQGIMLADLAKKARVAYEVPETLMAVACIFAQYFGSGIRLFNDDPLTYIRCKEDVQGKKVVVGGFSGFEEEDARAGLDVNYFGNYDSGIIGVAALRK